MAKIDVFESIQNFGDTIKAQWFMFDHEPFQPHNIAYLICRRPAENFSQFGTLVFCCQKSRQNANGVTPTDAPNAGGVG